MDWRAVYGPMLDGEGDARIKLVWRTGKTDAALLTAAVAPRVLSTWAAGLPSAPSETLTAADIGSQRRLEIHALQL